MGDETFELYDLEVEVVPGDRPMVCDHPAGARFFVHGEMILFPEGERAAFPLYPLAAILPLLPAKQRVTDAMDWMTSDAEIACPDPHCGGRFRITRKGKRSFRRADTTVTPLPEAGE